MSCLSQFDTLSVIHSNLVVGVWTSMAIRFSERLAFVDDRTDRFLVTLAQLGGYCTVEQAQAMELAKSPSQTQALLNGLERAGFLRRAGDYPVVYQITKSVVRLIGPDMSARRPHVVSTVRWRLAAVSFYLEARTWPAEFFFGHEEKISALTKVGCLRQLLPHRGGRPYLWEDFVIDTGDGSLCIAIVDRPHWNAFLQLLGFVKRFAACSARSKARLSLAVAVGSEPRRRLYENAGKHRRVLEYSTGAAELVTAYQVSTPIPNIRAITHEPVIHTNHDSRRN